LLRVSYIPCDGVEDTVNEFETLLRTKEFSQLNPFVDDHPNGDFDAFFEFECPRSKYAPLDISKLVG
tara:strand:+ start:410 stop:610 length:201 start_codon:yes stop_codon:yes gene_type:complete